MWLKKFDIFLRTFLLDWHFDAQITPIFFFDISPLYTQISRNNSFLLFAVEDEWKNFSFLHETETYCFLAVISSFDYWQKKLYFWLVQNFLMMPRILFNNFMCQWHFHLWSIEIILGVFAPSQFFLYGIADRKTVYLTV